MVFNTLQDTPPPNRPRNATKPTTKRHQTDHETPGETVPGNDRGGWLFSLSPQGVFCVPVAPEAVGGLYGSFAQYCAIACAIFRLVSSLRRLPVLAAAILSFCVCGISLRQILLAIVFIFDIVIIARIGFIINIVQIGKIQPPEKIYTPNCWAGC